jgi:hypothetical protein
VKCIVAVEVHKSHRQIIQYIKPDATSANTMIPESESKPQPES